MKRVSLKVAKTLKEAGYPQEKLTDKIYLVNCDKEGILAYYASALFYDYVVAPTYLEVWLWLWKNGISIRIEQDDYTFCDEYCTALTKDAEILYQKYYDKSVENPEEAISEAINYLVDNDLIK